MKAACAPRPSLHHEPSLGKAHDANVSTGAARGAAS